MHIILAIDSFKGCLTSEEVEAIFAQSLTARGATVRSLPMSDGGEGMLEAFISALHGQIVSAEVPQKVRVLVRCLHSVLFGAVITDLFQFSHHSVFGDIEYPVEV